MNKLKRPTWIYIVEYRKNAKRKSKSFDTKEEADLFVANLKKHKQEFNYIRERPTYPRERLIERIKLFRWDLLLKLVAFRTLQATAFAAMTYGVFCLFKYMLMRH